MGLQVSRYRQITNQRLIIAAATTIVRAFCTSARGATTSRQSGRVWVRRASPIDALVPAVLVVSALAAAGCSSSNQSGSAEAAGTSSRSTQLVAPAEQEPKPATREVTVNAVLHADLKYEDQGSPYGYHGTCFWIDYAGTRTELLGNDTTETSSDAPSKVYFVGNKSGVPVADPGFTVVPERDSIIVTGVIGPSQKEQDGLVCGTQTISEMKLAPATAYEAGDQVNAAF